MEEKRELIYEVPKEVFDRVERIRLTVEGEEEGRYLYIEELLHKQQASQLEEEGCAHQKDESEETIDAQQMLQTLFQTINMLDQIATSYAQDEKHQLVAEQLRKVADMTVHQLRNFHIEEIPIYGEPLDGRYMQSFGPAQTVVDESLEPHTVAIVQQRAFRQINTGDVLQDAIVYTTPEEEGGDV